MIIDLFVGAMGRLIPTHVLLIVRAYFRILRVNVRSKWDDIYEERGAYRSP